MVLSLIKRLTAKTVEPLNPDDARLALSALLVRIARTDGQYDVSEVAEIARVLMERYGLNKTAA
ncbi:MAG: putative tellurite resistance protein B-like protein, partial [Planctomycetota bacterium]